MSVNPEENSVIETSRITEFFYNLKLKKSLKTSIFIITAEEPMNEYSL